MKRVLDILKALGNEHVILMATEMKSNLPNLAAACNKSRTDDEALNCAPARSLHGVNKGV